MHRLTILLTALAITLAAPLCLSNDDSDDAYDSVLASIFQSILEAESKPATDAGNRAADRMWIKLCTKLREGIDCSAWTRPDVRTFAKNPLRPGLQGYYDGTNVIYIRDNLYTGDREEVLAHEMSHYVDNLLGILPPLPVYLDDVEGIIALCTSEKIAWAVSDEYHRSELWGNPRFIVGQRWVYWYEHCTPYKDILYP